MARAAKSIEVAVPPDAFFRVLQDYGSYPEFLPEVRAVRVGPRSGEAVEVTYSIDAKIKVFEFTLRHVEHPDRRRVDWHLVRGEFMRKNDGTWTLADAASGGTIATYDIELQLALTNPVPAVLERALAQRGLPNMLLNFKLRAEKLHGGK